MKARSYKESYDAGFREGRMSVIISTAKQFSKGWEEFKKSEDGLRIIGSLENAGIKKPYSENIIWHAFNAGFHSPTKTV